MTNTKLLVQLRDLHEELSRINIDLKPRDSVDDETIDALGQLVTDVSRLVDRAKEAGEETGFANQRQDLLDRIVQFNNEHPRVSQFLTQMTDLLSMMGI